MNSKTQILLKLACALALTGPAMATEGLLSDDTTTNTGSVAATNGAAAGITVSSTTNKVGLLKFNITDMLPDGISHEDVATATLRLYVTAAPTGTGNITLHQNLVGWTEAALAGNWPAANYNPSILPPAPVSYFANNQFCAFDVTQIVQQWIANPSSNKGFALQANGTIQVVFSSKEDTAKSHHAVLDITLGRRLDSPDNFLTFGTRIEQGLGRGVRVEYYDEGPGEEVALRTFLTPSNAIAGGSFDWGYLQGGTEVPMMRLGSNGQLSLRRYSPVGPAGTLSDTISFMPGATYGAGRIMIGSNDVLTTASFRSTGSNSFAFGSESTAAADYSMVLGIGSSATGANSLALGTSTVASGLRSLSLGAFDGMSSGEDSAAIGWNAWATNTRALAMMGGTASGVDSTAIRGSATGVNSMAFGGLAQGINSVSIGGDLPSYGSGATAVGDYSFAIGNGATASGVQSFALGNGTNASGFRSINLGAYDNDSSGEDSVAIGASAGAFGDRALAMMMNANATADDAVAIGLVASATNTRALAMVGGSASGIDSTAIRGTASNTDSVAIGAGANASGLASVAIGVGAAGSGADSLALGRNTWSGAEGAVALGYNSVAMGAYSMVLGFSSGALGDGSIAFGGGLQAFNHQMVLGRYNDSTVVAEANRKQGILVIGAGFPAVGPTAEVRRNAMRIRDDGTILIQRQGDLSMGEFTVGEQP